MSTINIPDEVVYFVYNTKTRQRITKFYSRIGPAKSHITGMRGQYLGTNTEITNTYIICEMKLKLAACNQYRYNEDKQSIELTDMAKAIYL